MRLLLAFCLLLTPSVSAQILPDLTGDALLGALADAYTPDRVLSSSQSKDRLYDTVDEVTVDGQRGVLGFYTDFFVPFDGQPSSDPSQDVFNNEQGLNQEHVWPRSEGTDNNDAETDMHHLVPTRVRVNSDRASLPFAEIPDAQAVAWYRFEQTQSSPPTTDRNAYSERSTSAFEPREIVKGDVARMLFYVATIYDSEVGTRGRTWFDRQLPTLLAWHAADPADDAEVARSGRVASFQGNDNPFVLDATLARRAFAPEGVVHYVSAEVAEGTRGGSTWADAFANPTHALAAARPGDEVWIAAGTYTPTETGDRSISFAIPDSVEVYGGFAGTESSREDANPEANPTVLSGNIGASENQQDNSRHVVVAEGTLILDGITVSNGYAEGQDREGRGGGLLIEAPTTVAISRTVFSGNLANTGAGLYAPAGVDLRLSEVTFVSNFSPFSGGGFFMGGCDFDAAPSTLDARAVVVRRNTGFQGGGLYVCRTNVIADDLVLDNNQADTGGGIYAFLGSILLRSPLVTNNGAGFGDGGGIFMFNGGIFDEGPTIEGGSFTGNSASERGGAIGMDSGFLTLRGVTFEDNRAGTGGAIAAIPADVLIVNSQFTRNTAARGSALALAGTQGLVASSRFLGNEATEAGTVTTDLSSDLNVVSSAFVGNRAAEVSTLLLSARTSVHGSTFTGNIADNGDLISAVVGDGMFTNSIVWGNVGTGIDTDQMFAGADLLTFSNVLYEGGIEPSDVVAVTNLLDADPLFARAPSPGPDAEWGTADDDYGDLRLLEDSPAIDVGDAALLPLDELDLDGDGDTTEPLPLDLDGNARVLGSALDLGAYESLFSTPVEAEQPTTARVTGPYPNPTAGSATFAFTLEAPEFMRVEVLDRLGRRVALLHEGVLAAEQLHTFEFQSRALPSGLYVLRLQGEQTTHTRRVTLVR